MTTSKLKRFIPIIILVVGLASFFAFDGPKYFQLSALQENHTALSSFVEENFIQALAIYMLFYIVAVAFSLPLGLISTITGGFLFGGVVGTMATVLGASLGALSVFLAARFAFADLLRSKAGGFIEKMREGFAENAFFYMLSLRLVPAFPFFIVNLVPAFLNVRTSTYFTATFIGIIPGTAVYSQVGSGLRSVIAQGDNISLQGAVTSEIIAAFVGLGLLSLLPVVFKAIKKRKAAKDS